MILIWTSVIRAKVVIEADNQSHKHYFSDILGSSMNFFEEEQ